ncbi:ribonuclease Z [Sporolactobacillus shoreicorticis]|uniref:Ribonuclease Z n=1 Tax=Sporolactobacillus shoreicorticis TaxID=1923877 RepID=A0ABW5RZA7_9BACL|nr:ribonuclease Z [Sporolactobacillus shoreicorticis]MCO7126786.1 ribonuclease Z [Sporolactobacillus shoreicorticis]
MRFTFLGTGAGMPAKERNVTSLAVNFPEYDGDLWLFDCGEGTQRQILYTSVKLTKLSVIFITHLHGDHLFGLPGILGSRSFQGALTPLTLIGPKGLRDYIETSLRVSGTHLCYSVNVYEIDSERTVYENDHFIVDAGELDHGIKTYGYRITEKDQPGELLVDKLLNFGVRPGPIYKKIKEQESVTLPDGRVLDTAAFIGKRRKGRTITILGDTRPCEMSLHLAKNADLLIHEATFSGNCDQLAHDYHHSTSLQAASTADHAQAKALILTHLSSRYQKKKQSALLDEAKAIFPITFLAHDLWTYELKYQSRH